MRRSSFAVLVIAAVAFFGAGCSQEQPATPAAPLVQPTRSPVIPPNAQNVPKPYGY